MKIKDILTETFSYNRKNSYHFSLPDDPITTVKQSNKENNSRNVFTDINKSLDYIKTKYNLLINSDVITREFILNAKGKQFKAFLLYIDGMVDSQILNDFVLKPLMMRNQNNFLKNQQSNIISESVTNNVTIRKVKKFNLVDYVQTCLIPQNNIELQSSFNDIFLGVNSGNCALFIDTLDSAFDIDVKGFKQRSIDKPENEVVIKGSHEAFVENIRTNTSLIRRFTNNENLVIENLEVGKLTKTKCAVCYMQNIANDDLVAEVKYRINNVDVDSVLSAGQLEQLISDNSALGLPKALSTERPDNATQHLLEGRVIVLINGSPFALSIKDIL